MTTYLMKPRAIIVDLDGTLCNTSHRQHLMTGEKKDWDGFYKSLVNDPIHEWCLELINNFDGYETIFVSGRPSDYLNETIDWLRSHGLASRKLFMRKSGDFRKDSIIKEEIYREYIEPHYRVLFCVDDRKQVVDMWRSIGLTCLQCAEGDF